MVKNEKVKSIFMGKVTRKKYNFVDNKTYDKVDYCGKPYINEIIITESREKIAECEITGSPFEEKETVYIPEIGKYTTIDKVARGTNGSDYYNVTYIIKELDDDNKKSFIEKLNAETNLKEALIKYNEYLGSLKDKENEEAKLKKELKVLYIEPIDLTLNSCSIICYYGKRKYTYKNVTLSNLEEMLKGSCYLGIDKENTLIYVDAIGIGMWIYDALLNRGYNIEPLFTITKVVI